MTSSLSLAIIGDALHIANIVGTLAFALAVAKFPSLFDAEWAKEGFCVVNKMVFYQSSHDWCFYLDMMLALLMTIIYWRLRERPGMISANALVKSHAMAVAGHGMGHALIAKGVRDGNIDTDQQTAFQDMPVAHIIGYQIGLLIFWVSLLKAVCLQLSIKSVSVLAVVFNLVSILIPIRFVFTYVQTVILLCFSIDQLNQGKAAKGFEYALFAAVNGVPVILIAWLESTSCTSGLVQALGGHVMYDVYIALGSIVFYVMVYIRQQSMLKNAGSKKTF